jgi:ribose-phosphate pyrophosphokinase
MSGLTGRTKIYAGSANKSLAQHIASYLGMQLSPIELTQFSDGEIRCEIPEHIRKHHTFIIQPTCAPVNDHIMEVMVLADALRRQNVKDITAVIPYYGYARQDRKPGLSRTPITSRLIANMLEMVGVNQVIVVDIHSEQQLGFFNIPVINISAAPIIVADIWRNHAFDPRDLVIVSPDTGGVARARSIAKQLDNAQLAIIDKRRPEANVAEVMNIIGDVEGKRCIIVDDMIDTAGTLCKAATALKEKGGAAYVAAYATHPVFSGKAYQNIEESNLDEVVVTDTIPVEPKMTVIYGTEVAEPPPDKIRQISVAGLIAETMRRVRSHQSVSEIYTGT